MLFLLDGTSGDVKTDFKVLQKELKLFNKDLIKKPTIVAITKLDIIEDDILKGLKRIAFKGVSTHIISAVARIGIDGLVDELWSHVGLHKKLAEDEVMNPPTPRERRTAREKARKRKRIPNRRREWE